MTAPTVASPGAAKTEHHHSSTIAPSSDGRLTVSKVPDRCRGTVAATVPDKVTDTAPLRYHMPVPLIARRTCVRRDIQRQRPETQGDQAALPLRRQSSRYVHPDRTSTASTSSALSLRGFVVPRRNVLALDRRCPGQARRRRASSAALPAWVRLPLPAITTETEARDRLPRTPARRCRNRSAEAGGIRHSALRCRR